MSTPTASGHPPARDRLSGDLIAALFLTGLLGLPYLLMGLTNHQAAIAFATTVLMSMALTWRRSRPVFMLALVTLAGVIQLLVLRYPATSVVVIPLATYSFARWSEGRRSRLILPLGAAASLLGPFTWLRSLFGMSAGYTGGAELISVMIMYAITVMVCAGLVITPYAIGRRVRESVIAREQQRLSELQVYASALNEREAAGRMAEARARAQIARELHDVVAHSLSVMIVQAEGGRALAAKKPEKAAEVLDTIATTGRDALGEMRRIVGVLRGTDEAPDYAPSPGLGDIPEMVARAGDRVSLEISGDEPVVPTSLGLTVYRIAQEAVTNVLKHAGPDATAQVSLTYLPTMIVLQVVDDGPGVTLSDGKGHGVRGMHERVASMGGRVIARPLTAGGFLVRALLPLPGHRLEIDAPDIPTNPEFTDPDFPTNPDVTETRRLS